MIGKTCFRTLYYSLAQFVSIWTHSSSIQIKNCGTHWNWLIWKVLSSRYQEDLIFKFQKMVIISGKLFFEFLKLLSKKLCQISLIELFLSLKFQYWSKTTDLSRSSLIKENKDFDIRRGHCSHRFGNRWSHSENHSKRIQELHCTHYCTQIKYRDGFGQVKIMWNSNELTKNLLHFYEAILMMKFSLQNISSRKWHGERIWHSSKITGY